MKKIVYSLFVICLAIILLFQGITVFAESDEPIPEWQDITLSQQEFEDILSNNPNNAISPYTTGLINIYSIAVKKSGSTLIIVGSTICISSVVKCGFKTVTIQRKTSSETTWHNYLTYYDLYNDSSSYALSKSVTVASGYQYRVVCTHYAKKNIFSTQKIDNTSNIV